MPRSIIHVLRCLKNWTSSLPRATIASTRPTPKLPTHRWISYFWMRTATSSRSSQTKQTKMTIAICRFHSKKIVVTSVGTPSYNQRRTVRKTRVPITSRKAKEGLSTRSYRNSTGIKERVVGSNTPRTRRPTGSKACRRCRTQLRRRPSSQARRSKTWWRKTLSNNN